MATKKLRVQVLSGKNLAAKNGGNQSDPYCEVVVLDDQGVKLGKAQSTRVVKGSLDPQWNHQMEFNVGSSFSGLVVRCWDKHKFRPDKFMGQFTIKFNTALLSSTEKLDDWFPLKKRKAKEIVSGEIHLQIQYGDLKEGMDTPTKDRSATLGGETVNDMRVSTHFVSEETNNRLKNSTHVVVEEDDRPDDVSIATTSSSHKEEDYEKIREGPSNAALEKLSSKEDKNISITNKNLDATNNASSTYGLEYVVGNVRVNGGKWQYEARIVTTGQMQIGWCTTNYNPRNNTGNFWSYDGSRQVKATNGDSSQRYGDYWSTGDIIGVAMDTENKTIQFYKNGKDMGVAFTDVNPGSYRLCPFIALSRRVQISCNFGKEPFAFPAEGYNILHSFLSEKEIDQLTKLFTKYRDIGNNALIEEKKEELGEEKMKEVEIDLKDSIHGIGLIEFTKDLGSVDDDDPLFFIIAFKLHCEKVWEISREEFMNGFTIHACATMDKIKSKCKEWREELKTNSALFKQYYNFIFDYLKEDKKILLTDEAIIAWNIVLKDKEWKMYPDLVKFLQEEQKKSVSRDAWQQLWHFMQTYPVDLKQYDTMSSWPIVFDEFVEWMEKQGKK